MVKLSIAVGGASYDQNNTHYSPFYSVLAEDDDERITLPGLVMIPKEPRISYIPHSIPYISLDYLPAPEEVEPIFF